MTLSELTPAQVAERSGLKVSALHFYEQQGLITATRTGGNQRRYPRDTLRRLAFIGAAQRVGISLARIREALHTLPQERTPTPGRAVCPLARRPERPDRHAGTPA